jgi:transcription termination/antitermination protein NusG
MGAIPAPRDQWFVIHVRSGMEMRVRDSMLRRMQSEEMGDLVFQILLPMEKVQETKNKKTTVTNRKFFPGYIIANIHLLDEHNRLIDRSWYFVKETDGVLNFAGAKDQPIPMRAKEVELLLAQIRETEDGAKPKIAFSPGDQVRVADGPFEAQMGTVEEIDPERGVLRVSVNIFGRSTPVDLEYWQVEKA